MVRFLLSLVFAMNLQAFADIDNWVQYNSSLLIEVTRPTGVFTCTGVAVAPSVILTAAHCLEGDVRKVRVFTQDHYDPGLSTLPISFYKIHHEYNPGISRYRSDVAKIIMKDKLPSSINLVPIHTGPNLIGNIYRFGFGARDNQNIRTVVTPKFRQINQVDHILELDDKFSRSGDSGGPIFIQNGNQILLLAIHSTFSHGPEGEFSLNPLLSTYLPWIYEN